MIPALGDLGPAILFFYLIAHSPAIVMLIVGLAIRKRNANISKVLLIISAAYFVIGGGICGLILTG